MSEVTVNRSVESESNDAQPAPPRPPGGGHRSAGSDAGGGDGQPADRSVEFDSVNALLTFLVYCESGTGIQIDRPSYAWLRVATGPRYAVSYPHEKWPHDQAEAPWFRGKATAGIPGWTRLHLNELLLRLPLLPRPCLRGHIGSLVLVSRRSADQSDAASDEDLAINLYEAWTKVPKQEGTQNEFRFCRKAGAWFSVEIVDIAAGFDFAEFRDKLPTTVRAYVPAWHAEFVRCSLYVADGLRHSRANEFSSLYDFSVRVNRDDHQPISVAFQHLVLLDGGERVDAEGLAAVMPQVYLLGGDDQSDEHYRQFSSTDEIYSFSEILEGGLSAEPLTSVPMADIVQFPLELGISSVRSNIGILHDLETRIGKGQRELENLQSSRNRLVGFAKDEHVPIFMFHQASTADTLPEALDNFLRRPLGELEQYSYVRTVAGKGYDHWVIAETRMPLATVLGTPCTDVFICQGQWWDWSLYLFVRNGFTLNFELGESGLIDKFVDFLDKVPGLRDRQDAYVLAEPAEDPSELGVRFRVLAIAGIDNRPLDEMLQFTNQHAGGMDAMVSRAHVSLDLQAVEHNVEVHTRLGNADTALLRLAEGACAEAETRWEEVRVKAQETLLHAEITDVAIKVTQHAYQSTAESWLRFLEIVSDIDGEISKSKVNSLGHWFGDEGPRDDLIERIKLLQTDVEDEITHKRTELDAKLIDLRATAAELEKQKTILLKLEKQAELEHAQCEELDRELEPMRKLTDQRESELRNKQAKLADEIAKGTAALLTCTNLQTTCQGLKDKLTKLHEHLQTVRDELEKQELELRAVIEQTGTSLAKLEEDLAGGVATLQDGVSAWLERAQTLGKLKGTEFPKLRESLKGIRDRLAKAFPNIPPVEPESAPQRPKSFWERLTRGWFSNNK